MADEVIIRDENSRTVGAGVSNDADQDILMLRVDPITNYLLVDITDVGATSGTASPIASRDQNSRTVCMGWDATNGVLQEILTDENGYILCDVDFI
jgi:hypothetical protein